MAARSVTKPLDPDLVWFQVRNGIHLITCNVSDEALEAVSSLEAESSMSLRRRSFDRFRMLIEAAARLKLTSMPADFSGRLVLSSRDLRLVPPAAGVPVYGSLGRRAPDPAVAA
ncbi:DUF1488 family protein [Lichenicoccus roseus]|uniref:DUF1488 domain-containing protein n=1 Tax=Lichenicoccus roseus TaxID=2683649 RepID=A0A5R9JD15_9PROT|nr:DUF1488 family protein [Lichenicoccus roseus]TLU73501.1 DUF1488 domain-containing protein [Lichenicoccus roseus]